MPAGLLVALSVIVLVWGGLRWRRGGQACELLKRLRTDPSSRATLGSIAAAALGIRVTPPSPGGSPSVWRAAVSRVCDLDPARQRLTRSFAEVLRRCRPTSLETFAVDGPTATVTISGARTDFEHALNCLLLGRAFVVLLLALDHATYEIRLEIMADDDGQPLARLRTSRRAVESIDLEHSVPAQWAVSMNVRTDATEPTTPPDPNTPADPDCP